ncbi:dihydrofolate reductase [Flavobacterium sp. ST-75]|uniref:Dihydrofolate reductase n=1 Tax=Flavobacterium rhizophilum TaxID=3163296 RepID=A0ABW8YAL1_9FLAO
MTITLIAAAAENNALGKDNQMIWHLPDDFKRFKQLTSGHYIIMGRKTFDSLPGMLPNRTHVIITRQQDYTAENCIIANSLEEAIKACPQDEEVFVIGGGEIYKQSLPFADKIELTRVHGTTPEADAFFPEIDPNKWELTEKVYHPKDDKHKFDFTFETFVKNTGKNE